MPNVGSRSVPDIQTSRYDSNMNISDYSRDEGLLVLPVMGPPGTPPKIVRVHAPIGNRTVRWSFNKRGSPPIMPAMSDTPSGDRFVGGVLAVGSSLGGDQNQLDYVASGEYSYAQNVEDKGPRLAAYNVQSVGGGVIDAANTEPIIIQTDGPHGLITGNKVTIGSVPGNTAANGIGWTVTVLSTTEFSLNGSEGNGSYTAGGTWSSGSSAMSPRGQFPTGRIPYVTPKLNAMLVAGGGLGLVGGLIDPNSPLPEIDELSWFTPGKKVSADAVASDINFSSASYLYYDSVISSLFFDSGADLIL